MYTEKSPNFTARGKTLSTEASAKRSSSAHAKSHAMPAIEASTSLAPLARAATMPVSDSSLRDFIKEGLWANNASTLRASSRQGHTHNFLRNRAHHLETRESFNRIPVKERKRAAPSGTARIVFRRLTSLRRSSSRRPRRAAGMYRPAHSCTSRRHCAQSGPFCQRCGHRGS